MKTASSSGGLSVIELYESQGCSSCPPAIRNANALADRKDMLVLTFSVTYWDYLGWKDIYGQPAFTQRQHDYANGSGRSRVSTPQMIINGRTALVGDRPDEIRADLAKTGRIPTLSVTSTNPGTISLRSSGKPQGRSDVWLVRYDPHSLNVPIRSGENAGRTIAHRNVVFGLKRLGGWDGSARTFDVPAAGRPGLAEAILVQAPNGGPLLAAAKL
ncbi:DUF1223 domain-containing protein [Sphingomonas jaspsi]|uniref:DUF1223 domain-containing protein n=1 Tax=Sphingomonas jaspsi TaxID=392409 RepID=UPI00146FA449|nr:DUF1223 domain-containing protein [Sphingomonas jaspsi]